MDNLKIAIFGSHCTGKTTLAKALSSELKIPYINGDVVKKVTYNFSKKSPLDLTLEEYWSMELQHYSIQLQDATKNKTFISDGGFLLNAAYLGLTHNLTNSDPAYKAFTDLCINQTKELYSHIIYLPPEIAIIDDGFKPQDIRYRINIDKFLTSLLKKNDISFTLVKGNVSERVKQTLAEIKNNLKI